MLGVLIADDQHEVAEVVAYAVHLIWPDARVTIATNGSEALRRFAAEPADLVILDVMMPQVDGFEVCRSIRARSRVPILMLTARNRTLDKVRALDLGADDFLTKPFDHLELIARLRALRRRAVEAMAPGDALLGIGDVTLDSTRHEVRLRGEAVHLTATEFHLLELLMRNAGAVLTRAYLLERVWGPAYEADQHSLKVFVERLRRKLGDNALHPRYIETVRGKQVPLPACALNAL